MSASFWSIARQTEQEEGRQFVVVTLHLPHAHVARFKFI